MAMLNANIEISATDIAIPVERASAEVFHPLFAPKNDELAREVYGILGIPVDVLDRSTVMLKIVEAAAAGRPLLLSTPNVNFLATSRHDASFRESLMHSDLCVPDGMPIVWLAKLLGIPVKERVSGSDLFDAFRRKQSVTNPIRVFLFGGADGVSEAVAGILNSSQTGIRCAGWLNPGFGTFEEMSTEEIISKINGSNADLVAVFLTAKKAQSWLLHNHDALTVPIRGQFGATINYQAGVLRRAPKFVQNLGFEWLWRIKEEPHLWPRYRDDGLALVRLVATHALPFAFRLNWRRFFGAKNVEELSIDRSEADGVVTVSLAGFATKAQIAKSIVVFRGALSKRCDLVVDISQTRSIDPRFFGLLLMLRKQLKASGNVLKFAGVSNRGRRMFRRNGFEFLLEANPG